MANITTTIDDDIIRRAKVIAAKRGTSVSAMVRDFLKDIVEQESTYQVAMNTALRHMQDETLELEGAFKREDVYTDRLGR